VAIGKMLPLIVLAFCGVFALCGAAVAAVTTYRIREGIAAARWPTATAVVKSLVVKDEPGSEGGISRHVEVAYTFMLNGVAYDGTRIHPVFIPCASVRRLVVTRGGTWVWVHVLCLCSWPS
jgi:hypothetical protein